jgi:hypothetical protein
VAFGYMNYIDNNDNGSNFIFNKHYNIGDIVTDLNENYICINENEGTNAPFYD